MEGWWGSQKKVFEGRGLDHSELINFNLETIIISINISIKYFPLNKFNLTRQL